MRTKVVALASFIIILASVEDLNAQVLTGGFAVGGGRIPPPFVQTCGGNPTTWPLATLRLGMRSEQFSITTRASVHATPVPNDCDTTTPSYSSGVHTTTGYSYDRATGGASLAAVIQYRANRHIGLGLGGGTFTTWDSPFGAALISVQSGGRFAFFAEIESRWTRVRSMVTIADWQDHRITRVISSNRELDWQQSTAIQMGVDVPLKTF